LEHLHSLNIAHRDIKPENLVYRRVPPKNDELILIDFGLSKLVKRDVLYDEIAATPNFLPPEYLKKKEFTGEELIMADIWATGITAYTLLTGHPPFFDKKRLQINKNILFSKIDFPDSCKLSQAGVMFICKLLRRKSSDRPTAREALKDFWFLEDEKMDSLQDSIRSELKSNIRKIMSRVVDEVTPGNIDDLKIQFNLIDVDQSKGIDRNELEIFLSQRMQMDDKFALKFFDEIDMDKNNVIDFDEFRCAWNNYRIAKDIEVRNKVFDVLDKKKTGGIHLETIRELSDSPESISPIEDISFGKLLADVKEVKRDGRYAIPQNSDVDQNHLQFDDFDNLISLLKPYKAKHHREASFIFETRKTEKDSDLERV